MGSKGINVAVGVFFLPGEKRLLHQTDLSGLRSGSQAG